MTTQDRWVDLFPGLSRLDASVKDRLTDGATLLSAPKGATLFAPGQTPQNMLMLLEGTVRVQQVSESGHEIVLYRIEAGQVCVLTTACLLAYEDYAAEGIADSPIKAAAVPRDVFDDLLAECRPFRDLVFAAFSKRMTDLFLTIDEVAFQKMDVRLAHKLLELAKGAPFIATTHQALSVELGTAREVVSRQLQEFQRRGWIVQTRGQVTLQDRAALETLVQQGPS